MCRGKERHGKSGITETFSILCRDAEANSATDGMNVSFCVFSGFKCIWRLRSVGDNSLGTPRHYWERGGGNSEPYGQTTHGKGNT